MAPPGIRGIAIPAIYGCFCALTAVDDIYVVYAALISVLGSNLPAVRSDFCDSTVRTSTLPCCLISGRVPVLTSALVSTLMLAASVCLGSCLESVLTLVACVVTSDLACAALTANDCKAAACATVLWNKKCKQTLYHTISQLCRIVNMKRSTTWQTICNAMEHFVWQNCEKCWKTCLPS